MPAAAKPRPRTKPPEERRSELMSAAERLFLKHGVAATTVEQITSAAKVAKGTFYLYFSTKEDVLAGLGEQFAQTLLTTIKNAVAAQPQDDWKGRLTAWAAAAVRGYLESIRLHDILFYSAFHPPTREGMVDNVVIDHLTDLLASGAAAGAWSIDDPRATAVFLFSGLHGVVDHAYNRERRLNRQRLTSRLQTLCLAAIAAR